MRLLFSCPYDTQYRFCCTFLNIFMIFLRGLCPDAMHWLPGTRTGDTSFRKRVGEMSPA